MKNKTEEPCPKCGGMKAVLLSIKPKYCELIASGNKTVEIRKNRPKIDVPFKCYIYCTKPKQFIYSASMFLDELYRLPNGKIKFGCSMEVAGYENYPDNYVLNSKVIGEFVCDDIDKIAVFDDILYCVNNTQANKLKQACLTIEDIKAYLGIKNSGYTWHISDLVIYDKPKKLSEFKKYDSECLWRSIQENGCKDLDGNKCRDCYLQRPPQSWCYVEEMNDNG